MLDRGFVDVARLHPASRRRRRVLKSAPIRTSSAGGATLHSVSAELLQSMVQSQVFTDDGATSLLR